MSEQTARRELHAWGRGDSEEAPLRRHRLRLVLLLADDLSLRRVLPRLSPRYQIQLTAVGTADELYDRMAEDSFDAFVCDFRHGDRAAAGVIRNLRAWGCPLIVWSSDPDATRESFGDDVRLVAKTAPLQELFLALDDAMTEDHPSVSAESHIRERT